MLTQFLTSPSKEWSSEDASALRTVLSSPLFQRALGFVLEEKPELLDGSDVNKTLVASGEVKGFQTALEVLFRLTYEQPKVNPDSQNYPSLDDEAAWEPKDSRAVDKDNPDSK